MEPLTLEIRDLHVNVEGKEILKGVNLVVRQGETHALMGPIVCLQVPLWEKPLQLLNSIFLPTIYLIGTIKNIINYPRPTLIL